METALIRQTDFEELVRGYREQTLQFTQQQEYKEEHDLDSNRNRVRKDRISSEVQGAYVLLRDLGKPYTPMTIREFELAQNELRKIAQAGIDDLTQQLKNVWFFRLTKKRRLKTMLNASMFKKEHGYSMWAKDNTFKKALEVIGTTWNGVDWTKQHPPNTKDLVEEIFHQRHIGVLR